jgi:hypothetical protein
MKNLNLFLLLALVSSTLTTTKVHSMTPKEKKAHSLAVLIKNAPTISEKIQRTDNFIRSIQNKNITPSEYTVGHLIYLLNDLTFKVREGDHPDMHAFEKIVMQQNHLEKYFESTFGQDWFIHDWEGDWE